MKRVHRAILIVLGGSLLLAACAPYWGGSAPYRGGRPGGWWGGDFASNGERIYFTATNERGEFITYSGGPAVGMMGRMPLACVSCHGPDGRGGRFVMHMQPIDAPDIRYEALASEEEHEEEGEGHGEEGYDLETFRLAVVEGKHPNGDPLDRNMPRWNLSDEDLADLFEYLKSLP